MGRLTTPVRVFVSASAIGYYGIGGDEVIDERGRPTQIFQSQLCQDWEAAARAAARLGARLVRVRFGLVLGNDGGALPRMMRPIRLGFGAVLGTGAQWVSWIHIEDLVRLLEFAIDTPRVSGPLNAVSPEPVTHRHFQKRLAQQLRRPLWLRAPAPVLRAALGEMAQLLVDGQRVVPSYATTLGFKFHHPRIEGAFRDLLGAASAEALTEVYYNGECPVCRSEMTHYETLCAHSQPTFRFIDSMQRPNELAGCGLRREHLERRVYLRDTDGRILSGMPALFRLWSTMPEYRWLSKVLTFPLLRPLSILLYDHIVAPSLAYWAARGAVSQRSIRHGWF
jgi:predicted DCC family thiol-disulfide oxidoreductase YuxK